MIPLLEPREAVFLDRTAWQSWINKAAAAASGTAMVTTPLEHNSAMVALGNLCDELSDPSRFASTQQQSTLGGPGIYFANYPGPQPPAALMPTGTTNNYVNARIPVVGAQVAPASQASLPWWEMLREVISRLGSRWTASKVTPVVQSLTSQVLVLADGVVAQAVIPLRQIPADGTLGVVEDPDAAKYINALFNAASAMGQRLVNQAAGSVAATDTTASALELAAQPQVTAISDMYRAEHKTTSLIGAGGLAAAALAGLLMPSRRSRGRKRSR